MADYPFWLYDTVVLDTNGATEWTLFQVAQGADSTHTKNFTNMRASGALPQNEEMLINSIHVVAWGEVPEADLALLFQGNFLEVVYSDENLFRVPLPMCASHNAFGGVLELASAAAVVHAGLQGMGLSLTKPVKIMGGDSFKVNVYQESALSANAKMWVILEGILTRK